MPYVTTFKANISRALGTRELVGLFVLRLNMCLAAWFGAPSNQGVSVESFLFFKAFILSDQLAHISSV